MISQISILLNFNHKPWVDTL